MDTHLESQKHTLNFLEEFLKSEDLNKKIEHLRWVLGIPTKGFVTVKNYRRALESGYDIFRKNPTRKRLTASVATKAREELLKIVDDFPAINDEITYGFELYLYYNFIAKSIFTTALLLDNTCKLVPIRDEILRSTTPKTNKLSSDYTKKLAGLSKKYPIALFIHQDASDAEIVNYVRKTRELRLNMMRKYKRKDSKVGKIKTKNYFTKTRNEFIYKNRLLSNKEIASLVAEKFGSIATIEPSYVAKIKRDMIKKRK